MKPWRLGHVDIFSQGALKKYIVNVKLAKFPSFADSNAENQTDYRRFHHGTECLMIVQARALMKPFGHESDFVTSHCAI
jgi:hypothetical protein